MGAAGAATAGAVGGGVVFDSVLGSAASISLAGVSVKVRVLPAGAGKEAGAAPIALQYIVGVQADGAAGFTDVVRCATTLGGSTTQMQYNDAGVSAGSGGRHHPHLLDDRELFVVARLEPAADTVAVARPTPAWSTRRDGCSSGRTPGRWAPR